MNADDQARREDEALDWIRRIADPDFDAWAEHLAWLERDPRNGAAFEAASLLIEDATIGLAPPTLQSDAVAPANDNLPLLRTRRRWGWWATGLAAAASLLAVVSERSRETSLPPRTTIATSAGETRTLRLADGTAVSLNGDSAISIAPDIQREVRLEHGQAFFEVAPRAGRRFRVLAGEAAIEDLATAFDVTRDGGTVEVAVREGAVLYRPDRGQVHLGQGQTLHAERGLVTVRRIEARAAGSWHDGRLIYHDAPLPAIARDLQRRVGVPIVVSSDVLARRFTGVIVLGAQPALLFRRIGSLLGVVAVREGRGWRLTGAKG